MNFHLFKNATTYTLDNIPDQLNDLAELQQQLSARKFQDILENATSSYGFINPLFDNDREELFHHVDGYVLIAHQSDSRKVPNDQVQIQLEKRMKQLEEKGTEITSQLKADLTETIKKELLPMQPVKRTIIRGYIDIARKLFVVDASQDKTGEDLARVLRTSLGSFPITPLRTAYKPCNEMANWLTEEEDTSPKWLKFDDDGAVHTQGFDSASQKIKIQGIDLDSEEVKAILEGMCIVKADCIINDEESNPLGFFTIQSKPQYKSRRTLDLRLSGIKVPGLSDVRCSDDIQDINAAYLIMARTLGMIISKLVAEFGDVQGINEKDDAFTIPFINSDVVWLSEVVKTLGEVTLDDADLDPLFKKAKDFVAETRRASVSSLQRKFKIGYNRAASIMGAMEAAKMVSSPRHDGTREVLMAPPAPEEA